MTDASQPFHATAVAARRPGVGWRAALLCGAPGAGKSDLTLRLIARGWRLVGDDYVHLFASGGALYARAPETIAGRMEIRGLGIAPAAALGLARVALVVQLVHGPVERMPEPAARTFDGVAVPLLELDPREASALEKVAVALAWL